MSEQEPINVLDLPDDQVAELDVDALVAAQQETDPDATPEAATDDGTTDPEFEEETAEGDTEDSLDPDETESAAAEGEGEADPDETETVETDSEDSPDADYKAQLEQVLAPFKANGREMKVDSIDDVRQLMQMGANYNKKMAALKPARKLLKMLENNNLLDENKLSYLIDLDKKNPNAITKLIKESGLDPLSLDVDSDTEYKPETYTVDDGELELQAALEEIQDTPTGNETLEIVGNKWDEPSKRLLASNPTLLPVINEHVATGIYAQVMAEVERERVLGRLNGLSDLEAYKQVGDRIHAAGGFNKGTPEVKSEPATVTEKPKAKRAEDPQLKSRKRAASSTKSSPARKAVDDFNPLAMSDEEFERHFNARLL